MPSSRVFLSLVVLSTTVAAHRVAMAQSDSLHRDSAAPVATAGTDSSGKTSVSQPAVVVAVSAPAVPREVRGYQLTDSVHLGDISAGTQYTYTHAKKDVVNVFVSPYQRTDKLDLVADTINYVTDDVAGYYQSLYLAERRGELEFFRVMHHGESDLHVSGHTIRAADVWARMRRRGSPIWADTYFAVYALPTRVVRIRADLPLAIAANESVVPFTKSFVAALVTPP